MQKSLAARTVDVAAHPAHARQAGTGKDALRELANTVRDGVDNGATKAFHKEANETL